MSVLPEEILKDAAVLLKAPGTEARRRTAISRSYYAALHFLRGHQCATGYRDTPEKSIHRGLVRYLAGSNDAAVLHAARLLQRLRALREVADYDLGANVSVAVAQECIEDAFEVIDEALAAFQKTEPTRSS